MLHVNSEPVNADMKNLVSLCGLIGGLLVLYF